MTGGREPILLLTTDEGFARTIEKHLTDNGYQPMVASSLPHGIAAVWRAQPALVLVDRRLRVAEQLRADPSLRTVPIIAVQPPDVDCTVEECADDLEYGPDLVVCHEGYRELLARVRAVLRREHLGMTTKSHYVAGGLVLDVYRHEVTVEGRPVELTPKEFKILQELMQSPSRVFTRDELLNRIWGEGAALEEHTLDVHIHSLRHKIEADPAHPRYLITVRGVGYKLRAEQT